MHDRYKTRDQLIDELNEMRNKIGSLEARQAKLFSFHEKTPVPHQTIDNNGLLLDVNKAWIESMGYSRSEIIGKSFDTFLNSESRDNFLSDFPHLLEKEHVYERQIDILKKDGALFQGHVRIYSLDPADASKGSICSITDISDRKLLERLLRESEQKYRVLVEKALEGIVVAQNGLLVFVNQAAAAIIGVDPHEVQNRPFTEFIYGDDREMVFQNHLKRQKGEKFLSRYSFRIVRADNSIRWVEIDSGLVSWQESPAALFFMTDITERKKMEDEIRRSEEWYRSLVENSFDGVFVQQGSKIIFANSRLYEMLGYSHGELEGMDHWLVYHPEYHQITRDRAAARMRGEDVTPQYEVKLQKKDGSSFYGEISATPVKVFGETGVQVWVRDISRRIRSEEAQRRLATAIEQAAEVIVITDTSGRITYVNPAFEKITQYSREEVIGENAKILQSGKLDRIFYNDLWKMITSGHSWTGEFLNRKKDGTLYREDVTISPVRDPAGKIISFVAVKRDITHETELRQQLFQAQKMEAIGTLAGGVAHDFNNLLQVVVGYSQFLQAKKDPHTTEYGTLQKIISAAQKGADLVKGLLTFSRKASTDPRPLNLNNRITEVTSLLERTIPKMIKIETLLQENLPPVHADPAQMEQILMNLGVNAKDAMPDGGLLIIETSRVVLDYKFCMDHVGSHPGPHVMLAVSDTGHGVETDVIDHIFEPFFTTKDVGKGTGLGLAIVYGIVRQHGGCVTCESHIGYGTTFRVYLPEAVAKIEQPTAANDYLFPGGSETLLLVDDEEAVRDLASDLLHDAGYSILTSSNGMEAIDVYRKNQADISLVILDLIMPKLGGRDCLRELLRINPKVKVIIASGYSSGRTEEDSKILGAKGFVQKPYDLGKLLKLIRDALDYP
jgi:two-component system cell cycle sensor histidine kinase/response regulator CckA